MSDLDDYNGCVDLDTWPSDKPDCVTPFGPLTAPGVTINANDPAIFDGCVTSRAYVNAQMAGNTVIKGDLVIEDENGDTVDVGKFMKDIGERLCILQPNFKAMEEYPALKDAYDQYKMLEKLLMENNNDKKG